jgi:hypothetical protein
MPITGSDFNRIIEGKVIANPNQLDNIKLFGYTKLDSLRIAADLFHWKGAPRVIRQLSRELSFSGLTSDRVVQRLDQLYANPKYSQLDLGSALQLITFKTPREKASAVKQTGR